MNEALRQDLDDEARRRRLAIARQAYRDFFAQCFWSSDPHRCIEDADLPWIIRNLGENGGHPGYHVVEQPCR